MAIPDSNSGTGTKKKKVAKPSIGPTPIPKYNSASPSSPAAASKQNLYKSGFRPRTSGVGSSKAEDTTSHGWDSGRPSAIHVDNMSARRQKQIGRAREPNPTYPSGPAKMWGNLEGTPMLNLYGVGKKKVTSYVNKFFR